MIMYYYSIIQYFFSSFNHSIIQFKSLIEWLLQAHEVAGRGNDLKKIEDLGAILEEKLILDNR